MRLFRLVPMLALVAGALVTPAAPASAATTTEIRYVPTVGGAQIRVEITRDTRFDAAKQPVILTYSPYNTLSETSPSQDGIASRYNPRGIARAVADVLGTRGSTGCWDYGGLKEQQSGVDLVRYLAHLPWSNGNVGMTGVSYDGTTAYMVGARGNELPELKAIVPVAGISHWYGYAYYDGVRYSGNSDQPTDEGIDTPLAFDYGFNRTVAADERDPTNIAGRFGPCETESLDHTQHGYSRSPDYNTFWLDRDYRKDAANFRAAVLVVHGWQDYNVKQDEGLSIYQDIPVEQRDPATGTIVKPGVPFKRLWMTQESHSDGTGPGYQTLLDRFWDHTLKGVNNGVERDPFSVNTLGRTVNGANATYNPETAWPPAGTTGVKLHLHRTFVMQNGAPVGEDGTLSTAPAKDGAWTWADTGTSTEELSLRDPTNAPGHGYYSLYYKSAPLTQNVRLAGSAALDAWVQTTAPGSTLTPLLVEVTPDGTLHLVERGFLNLDYRNGLTQADPMAPNAWAHARVTFLPQDYTFTAGSRIGLIVQSSNTVWALPGAAGEVNISNGPIAGVDGSTGTFLSLPLVGPPGQLFAS
jgi:X-Pro dipeptidyl-peptidase